MRKKTRPRAEIVRKASKRARVAKRDRGTPAVRAAKAAQRQGGGAIPRRPAAGSFRSETGFDWLTDEDCRAFGNGRGLILTCHDVKRPVMARRLGLKPSTIDTHLARLHKKLGLKDRLAIRIAVDQFAQSRPRRG